MTNITICVGQDFTCVEKVLYVESIEVRLTKKKKKKKKIF